MVIRIAFVFLIFVFSNEVYSSCNKQNMAIPWSLSEKNVVDNQDGTVSFSGTKLMWMQCSIGQDWNQGDCIGSPISLTWEQVYSESIKEYHLYNDWRVPNINELVSIVEERCFEPTVNLNFFPNTPSGTYWSSSPYAGSGNGAWHIDFKTGTILGFNGNVKNSPRYLRLVRDIN